MKTQSKVISVVMLGALCVSLGCDSRPSAPVLRDAPVYQNNREGFRFLVPDGWLQSASSVLPPVLEGEVLLVQYRMRTPVRGASVEIMCFEEDKQSDLHEYHAGPSHGVKRWKSTAEPEQVDVNGTGGERFAYSAKVNKQEVMKEVVCFRRGKRVYSFIGLYYASDNKAPQQLRRAVESTIWRT